MLRTRKAHFTPAEYLAMEEVADYKSEFYDGEIFALSGGSADHSLIAVNCVHALSGLLDTRPCRVFNSDMRLLIQRSGLYTYPDVMVVCGKLKFVERRNDTLLNPLLIVEVLSDSTRDYGRGAKFGFYKQIPGLQEIVLVESEAAHVECYRRAEGDKWTIDAYDGLDAMARLESVGCDVPLGSLYHKVSWLD
jgi:Uma2 family endonuclease